MIKTNKSVIVIHKGKCTFNEFELSAEQRNSLLEVKEYKNIDFDCILISDKPAADLRNEFINENPVDLLIYHELKKDGQWDRYFTHLFNRLFYRLKGKVNNDFSDGKIPSNEKDFLISVKDVINHRLQILNEE